MRASAKQEGTAARKSGEIEGTGGTRSLWGKIFRDISCILKCVCYEASRSRRKQV